MHGTSYRFQTKSKLFQLVSPMVLCQIGTFQTMPKGNNKKGYHTNNESH